MSDTAADNDTGGRPPAHPVLEDSRKDQQEDDVEEIDGADGYVEDVGALVHPRAHHADGHQEEQLDEEQGKGLHRAGPLAEGNKHRLDEVVQQERDDEVVGRGFELDVQESPAIQSCRIRVQDVGGILVERHGPLGNVNNLPRRKGQDSEDRQEEADSEGHGSGRIVDRQLPQTQDGDLGEANKHLDR